MKSSIFFALIFSLVLNNTLSGQVNSCNLQDDASVQQVDLKDGGQFIAKSFMDEAVISRNDENGDQVWTKTFPVMAPESFLSKMLYPKGTGKPKGYLVSSQDGSNAFFVEMHVGFFGKAQARVSHFNAEGELRSFNFQDKNKVMGASLQATFCDNEFFYFLTTDTESQGANKGEINYILNRFSISDFRYERIALDLPSFETQEFPAFWTFLGQMGEEKVLVMKSADTENNSLSARLLSINPDGEIIKTNTITTQPKDQFIRPSNHIARKNWNAALHMNNDYFNQKGMKVSGEGVDYRIGAFFDVKLDEMSGELYISGLMGKTHYGKNPLKYKKQAYHGFYIQKFDDKGTALWNFSHLADEKSLSEDDFVKNFPPAYKNAQLVHYPEEGLVNYTIQVKDNLFNFAIDDKGQFLGLRKKEFFELETDNSAFIPHQKWERFSYFEDKKENSAYSKIAGEGLQASPNQAFSKQKGMMVF